MGEKCCACSKDFANGDRCVTFYFERARAGEKSGAIGFYDDNQYPDDAVDRVHFTYSCLEKCWSPADNPFMYDSIAEAVRQEIYDDEVDSEGDRDIPIAIEEDLPYCLWCKREDTIWMHQQRDMKIYNCLVCQKLWDQDEDELIWIPQHGYLVVNY